MKLTSQAVDDMMITCLFTDTEPMDNPIMVQGIIHNYGFHPQRIAENTQAITKLLEQLPDEFQANKGGGSSFLNACNDKHGNQWTGLHLMQERLLALGIAANKAQWLLPRDVWHLLPGGLPYVVVNTEEKT